MPVYGTGWYYPPYVSANYFYPRPPTWGLHVGYNPWTGWNFGVSWSNGFFSLGIGWSAGWGGAYRPWHCCGGWYGGGYRGPVTINTGRVNIGNTVDFGNRTVAANRLERTDVDRSRNIYNRPENRVRNADRATMTRNVNEARPVTSRQNDVFADRNGNVARRNGEEWQSRENGEWHNFNDSNAPLSSRATPEERGNGAAGSRVTPETAERAQGAAQNRAERPFTSQDFDRPSLDRSFDSWQHGAARDAMRPQMSAASRMPLRRR